MYTPSPVPDDAPEGLKAWLAQEMQRIGAATSRGLRAVPRTTPPSNPREGQIEFATGDWATTLGAVGLYVRQSGSWVKV